MNLYYLRERFFNIWYLMRNAPKRNQTKVIWLVRFLENWYDPAELVGRQVVIVANLAPRTIRGEVSEGMILAASSDRVDGATDTPDERDVVLLTLDKPVNVGSSVS